MRLTTRRGPWQLWVLLLTVASSTASAQDRAEIVGFSVWRLLGRFHVLTVHFPIALLVTVGLIEAVSWWRRLEASDRTTAWLAVLAAVSAVAAAGMGWVRANEMHVSGPQADLVSVHRWLGVATAALAVAVAALALRVHLRQDARAHKAYRVAVAITVIMVSATGHYGGLVVHGQRYFSSALPAWMRSWAARDWSAPGQDSSAAEPDSTPAELAGP